MLIGKKKWTTHRQVCNVKLPRSCLTLCFHPIPQIYCLLTCGICSSSIFLYPAYKNRRAYILLYKLHIREIKIIYIILQLAFFTLHCTMDSFLWHIGLLYLIQRSYSVLSRERVITYLTNLFIMNIAMKTKATTDTIVCKCSFRVKSKKYNNWIKVLNYFIFWFMSLDHTIENLSQCTFPSMIHGKVHFLTLNHHLSSIFVCGIY